MLLKSIMFVNFFEQFQENSRAFYSFNDAVKKMGCQHRCAAKFEAWVWFSSRFTLDGNAAKTQEFDFAKLLEFVFARSRTITLIWSNMIYWAQAFSFEIHLLHLQSVSWFVRWYNPVPSERWKHGALHHEIPAMFQKTRSDGDHFHTSLQIGTLSLHNRLLSIGLISGTRWVSGFTTLSRWRPWDRIVNSLVCGRHS